ncbi:MAG TPA: NADPH-dependent FMN reductase [Polyangia bacterium]|jgi:chromate reductase
MKVLGISGSLRKGSFNSGLIKAAIEVAPADMTIDDISIADIPPYNEDVRSESGYPPAVAALRAAVAAADALLIATPEYNFSIPGVLKNAIDWASRPPEQPFAGKPLALMSAGTGMLGGARAQYHLRQLCVFLDMHPINKPEVFVAHAPTKFDATGRLTDEPTRQVIATLLQALARWTLRLQATR